MATPRFGECLGQLNVHLFVFFNGETLRNRLRGPRSAGPRSKKLDFSQLSHSAVYIWITERSCKARRGVAQLDSVSGPLWKGKGTFSSQLGQSQTPAVA